jgi:hypothetical protein
MNVLFLSAGPRKNGIISTLLAELKRANNSKNNVEAIRGQSGEAGKNPSGAFYE